MKMCLCKKYCKNCEQNYKKVVQSTTKLLLQNIAKNIANIIIGGKPTIRNQSCEMSNFLHRQKFEFKILPQKRVIRN